MKADPIDEPEFDYVDGVEHIAVIKLLSLIGGSPVGLAKMKAIGSAIEKYVVAHEKTFTSKKDKCRWTGFHWGSCEDSCEAGFKVDSRKISKARSLKPPNLHVQESIFIK